MRDNLKGGTYKRHQKKMKKNETEARAKVDGKKERASSREKWTLHVHGFCGAYKIAQTYESQEKLLTFVSFVRRRLILTFDWLLIREI